VLPFSQKGSASLLVVACFVVLVLACVIAVCSCRLLSRLDGAMAMPPTVSDSFISCNAAYDLLLCLTGTLLFDWCIGGDDGDDDDNDGDNDNHGSGSDGDDDNDREDDGENNNQQ